MTRIERLILANQFAILEKVDPREGKWHAEARDIVESGYELMYDKLFRSISNDTLTEPECDEINRIMLMHSHLKEAYDALPDKTEVEAPRFEGFDGNGEHKLLSFAQFLCNLRGGFRDIVPGEHVPNSHSERLPIYRRMMEVYDAIPRGPDDRRKITKDDIKRIMAARIHPSMRK